MYAAVIDPLLRDIRAFVPHFSGMKVGDRVLDVCCGTGDQALHYAARGIEATGIDLSADMIAQAEKGRRKRGLKNVSFGVENATKLPFEDNSFDYASISLALHEKEGPVRDEVIAEMKRVVKRGGALIFVDYSVPRPPNLLAFLIRGVEFTAGGDHYRCFKDYLARGGLEELLRKNCLTEEKRGYLKKGTVAVIKTGNA